MSSNDKPKKKKFGENFVFDFIKVSGAPLGLLWFRPKFLYPCSKPEKIKGGCMVAANHITFYDPIPLLMLFWYRRPHSLATKDLYKNKLLKFFFDHCRCIPVDKENFNMETFYEVNRRLNEDRIVFIFPEGSVNQSSNSPMSFKSGSILMAHRAQKPILPVYLHKKEKWYHRQYIVVGKPFYTADMCGGAMPSLKEVDAIGEYLHNEEIKLMNYYLEYKNKKRD